MIEGWKKVEVHIVGVTPLKMHNERLCDPVDEFVIAIKKLTSKHASKKTDADQEEISHLEFLGGLYYSKETGVHVPDRCIHAMIRDAAKNERQGTTVEAALEVVPEEASLIYDGPTAPEKLWKSGNFLNRQSVGVNNNRVMRSRPIFRQWELAFDVYYCPELLNVRVIENAFKYAGSVKGFLDHRPRFGKFKIERFDETG